MKRQIQFGLVSIIMIGMTACMNYETLINKILPPDVDSYAKTCIQEAVNQDILPPKNLGPGVAFRDSGFSYDLKTDG